MFLFKANLIKIASFIQKYYNTYCIKYTVLSLKVSSCIYLPKWYIVIQTIVHNVITIRITPHEVRIRKKV